MAIADIKKVSLWGAVISASALFGLEYRIERDIPYRSPESLAQEGEYARYTDLFLSTEKAPAVAGAPDGVYVRTWRHKGQDWLLVINTLETSVKKCALEIEGYGAKEMFLASLDVQMSVLRD